MRLLNTSTLLLKEFNAANVPPYAILSHVWQDHERTFQEIQDLIAVPDRHALVSQKILRCCLFAEREGFEWIWIDTCCIDKTSSSELSEAINSMYTWYAQAAICYVFMHDVEDTHPSNDLSFRESQWFKRGWTLQELIAPHYVVFLSKEWHTLGTKQTLARRLQEITNINEEILLGTKTLDTVSVARRFSWAASRETTREEDRAYSLMGIFDVNLPAIYGEGSNAFKRLQLEILKRSDDQTIFAWGLRSVDYPILACSTPFKPERDLETDDPHPRNLLASSPSDFQYSSDILPIALEQFGELIGCSYMLPPEYTYTHQGIKTVFPIVEVFPRGPKNPAVFFAILSCQDENDNIIILFLNQPHSTAHAKYYLYHVGADFYVTQPPPAVQGQQYDRLGWFHRVGFMKREDLACAMQRWPTNTKQHLYINYRLGSMLHNSPRKSISYHSNEETYAFFFPTWVFTWGGINVVSDDQLQKMQYDDGYMVEVSAQQPERNVIFARDPATVLHSDPTNAQPEGFRLSIKLSCECHGNPLQHRLSFAVDMINPTPSPSPSSDSFPSSPSSSYGGHTRRRSLNAMLGDRRFTQTILRMTPSPSRRLQELPQGAESRHPHAPRRHSTSWIRSPIPVPVPGDSWQCEKKRTHIRAVSLPNLLLRFFSEIGKVEIALKRWDGCHRSTMQYVYLVDIKMTSPDGPDMYDSGGRRKSSLPTYTQGVIPETGLILYEPEPETHPGNALQLNRYVDEDCPRHDCPQDPRDVPQESIYGGPSIVVEPVLDEIEDAFRLSSLSPSVSPSSPIDHRPILPTNHTHSRSPIFPITPTPLSSQLNLHIAQPLSAWVIPLSTAARISLSQLISLTFFTFPVLVSKLFNSYYMALSSSRLIDAQLSPASPCLSSSPLPSQLSDSPPSPPLLPRLQTSPLPSQSALVAFIDGEGATEYLPIAPQAEGPTLDLDHDASTSAPGIHAPLPTRRTHHRLAHF
ncbi:hypothetical protein C8Q74DRAFT_1369867 [Fomes fomentarius]|nr:hypothetical protein C8Q74DRAFT_1369867 [Fomes fomentarius]